MTDSLRTFIALDLCSEHKAILKKIQTSLNTVDADIKWVKPENCHITLKFLGKTSQAQIKPITNILDSLANSIGPFPLELGTPGAFPTVEQPEIIWIGITRGSQELTTLSKDLEEQLAALGFLKEARTFHPHVTIARKRSNRNIKALSAALQSISIRSDAHEARHITLFESVLSSDGPRYSVVHRSPLKT